jgi:hypothetical protein
MSEREDLMAIISAMASMCLGDALTVSFNEGESECECGHVVGMHNWNGGDGCDSCDDCESLSVARVALLVGVKKKP